MISQGKLKQRIKEITSSGSVSHEILYQNFFFERFLDRLSKSIYRDSFILKGGFLLTSSLGIENRNTADIDMTIEAIKMNEDAIRKVITDICGIDLQDDTVFEIVNIVQIRQDDKYNGLRITILGSFHSLKFHFKLDLSTGDSITPKAKFKEIKLNIIQKSIYLKSYNFETVLAEKLETILSRGTGNSRAKDYFDIYAISTKNEANIDKDLLQKAFKNTMIHRNSVMSKKNAFDILKELRDSAQLSQIWSKYQKQALYVPNLSFDDTCDALESLLNQVYRE